MAYRETMQRSLEGLATTRGAKQQQQQKVCKIQLVLLPQGTWDFCLFICLFVLEYQEATRTFQGVCRVVLEEESKKMGLSLSRRGKKNLLTTSGWELCQSYQRVLRSLQSWVASVVCCNCGGNVINASSKSSSSSARGRLPSFSPESLVYLTWWCKTFF